MSKILFVNDDKTSQHHLLEALGKREHHVYLEDSILGALGILDEEEIDVVICDLRVSSEDGVAFLRRVRSIHPKVVRILRGGSLDESLIFDALRQGIAKHYFQSSWAVDQLVLNLEKVLRTTEKLRESTLVDMLNFVEQVPTIPKSYERIFALIEEEADVNRIVTEIEKDASIASKILQIVNTAFYGVKTGSVKRAIGFIGLENTLNLVLSTSVIHALRKDGSAGGFFDRTWDHSVMTNRLLDHLYQNHLRRTLPDLYLPAGLLHNIGIPFLMRVHGSKYISLLGQAAKSGQSLLDLEKNAFGVTHREAGGYLLQWWEFPHAVVEAALYANEPMDPAVLHWELVCAVNISSHYAAEILDIPTEDIFDPAVLDVLNLSRTAFERSLDAFRGQEFLGLFSTT